MEEAIEFWANLLNNIREFPMWLKVLTITSTVVWVILTLPIIMLALLNALGSEKGGS